MTSPQETITKVDNNIFIGGYIAAANRDVIQRNKIKAIVKMFADTDKYPEGNIRHPHVRYKVINCRDLVDYDITEDVKEALRFIVKMIRKKRDIRILVHCHAGVSRSATVVITYLMLKADLKMLDALLYLRSLRPVINPNTSFMHFLTHNDQILKRKRRERDHATRTGS